VTTARRFLIDPDPVVTPASNPHRVGAPSHHHISGSGENPMVGSHHNPDRATVEAVRALLSGQTYRFVSATRRGLAVSMDNLAVLVAEIVTELDAAQGGQR
jgi:hypothetical protein